MISRSEQFYQCFSDGQADGWIDQFLTGSFVNIVTQLDSTASFFNVSFVIDVLYQSAIASYQTTLKILVTYKRKSFPFSLMVCKSIEAALAWAGVISSSARVGLHHMSHSGACAEGAVVMMLLTEAQKGNLASCLLTSHWPAQVTPPSPKSRGKEVCTPFTEKPQRGYLLLFPLFLLLGERTGTTAELRQGPQSPMTITFR